MSLVEPVRTFCGQWGKGQLLNRDFVRTYFMDGPLWYVSERIYEKCMQ